MQLTSQDITLFLAAASAGGLGVFFIAAVMKKLLGSHFDSDMHIIVLVLSFVASSAQYVIQMQATVPPYILGVSMASVYGVSQLVYKISKWLSNTTTSIETAGNSQTVQIPSAEQTPVNAPQDQSKPNEATF